MYILSLPQSQLYLFRFTSKQQTEKGYHMKKLLLATALALPLLLSANAQAQRANHTKKDVSTQISETYDKAADKTKEAMHDMKDGVSKKMDQMKKKHSPEHKMKEEQKEIAENYDKAVKKINKSSFNQDQKNMLLKQAAENRDLMTKQLQDRSNLMTKHWDARKNADGFPTAARSEKDNRKAVKAVRKILDD